MTLASEDKDNIETHKMILSLGGRLVREAEEAAKPPDEIVEMLVEYGENGIIIDGIIAWIAMNTDMTADNILKQLLEKSVDLTEVLKSREVLKTAGGTVLAENHKDINQKTRAGSEGRCRGCQNPEGEEEDAAGLSCTRPVEEVPRGWVDKQDCPRAGA